VKNLTAIASLILLLSTPAWAGKYDDPRYAPCIQRDSHGRIKRSRYLIKKFKELYPCNERMKEVEACKYWQVDHIVPLGVGGIDAMINLQWLPTILKTCKGYCKDRWERKVYGKTPPVPDCK